MSLKSSRVLADGSAVADAQRVIIDRESEPYRWSCPNGHISWDRTNNHLWCPACRRALEAGAQMDVEQAEHWEVYDKQRDELVPYAAVNFADD